MSKLLPGTIASAFVLALCLTASQSDSASQQSTPDAAIKSGEGDVAGVVTSAKGAEAGVWVIAETTDLPTKFAKIVVTDERGRYLIPDLPKAKYEVWVRGYGLVDSPKVSADARAGPQPESRGRAHARRSGAVLPGGVLVCDAENPGAWPSSRKASETRRRSRNGSTS